MTRLKKNFHLSKSALTKLSKGVEVKVKDLVKPKKIYRYGNLTLDSDEEVQFCNWLDELKAHAYIHSWYRITTPIVITEQQRFEFITEKKRDHTFKIVRHAQSLYDMEYTPDFGILWSKYAEGIFYLQAQYALEGRDVYSTHQVQSAPFLAWNQSSIVDVKGEFIGQHNISGLTFPLIRKFLWHHQQILINKIIPVKLFAKTFVPNSLLTTKHGKSRKFPFSPVRTIEEFIPETKFTRHFPDLV